MLELDDPKSTTAATSPKSSVAPLVAIQLTAPSTQIDSRASTEFLERTREFLAAPRSELESVHLELSARRLGTRDA